MINTTNYGDIAKYIAERFDVNDKKFFDGFRILQKYINNNKVKVFAHNLTELLKNMELDCTQEFDDLKEFDCIVKRFYSYLDLRNYISIIENFNDNVIKQLPDNLNSIIKYNRQLRINLKEFIKHDGLDYAILSTIIRNLRSIIFPDITVSTQKTDILYEEKDLSNINLINVYHTIKNLFEDEDSIKRLRNIYNLSDFDYDLRENIIFYHISKFLLTKAPHLLFYYINIMENLLYMYNKNYDKVNEKEFSGYVSTVISFIGTLFETFSQEYEDTDYYKRFILKLDTYISENKDSENLLLFIKRFAITIRNKGYNIDKILKEMNRFLY
ncbi:MAG: hypothetical protein ACP5G1_02655 [Nanopusillaceae archaeon]